MAPVDLSDELLRRLKEFKPVVNAVLEEDQEFHAYVEFILHRGIDTLLQELIAPAGPEVLMETILNLGARHPTEVYTFVVDALRSGQAAEAAKRIREDYHTGQYL